MTWKKRILLALMFFVLGSALRWASLGFPGPEAISSYWVGSDALSTYCWINVMHDEGWLPFEPLSSSRLSYPEGFYFPQAPITEVSHWIFLRAIRFVISSPIAAFNLYYVFGAGLVCMSMALVCLALGISLPFALAAGLIYSALPFAFERIHHLFYSVYFDVPIGIFLAVTLQKKMSSKLRIILGTIVGLSNLYYSFFTSSLLCLVGLYHGLVAIWDRDPPRFKNIVKNFLLCLFPILAMIAIAIIPSVIDSRKHGESGGMQRSPQESLIWGLRLEDIFLPPTTHLLPFYEEVRPALFSPEYLYSRADFEGYKEYIGLLPIFGILLGLFYLMRRKKFGGLPFSEEIRVLVLTAVWFVVLGIRYGIGYGVALYLSPQIRSYNRVSIFIACAGLLILVFWIFTLTKNHNKKNWIIAGLTLLALVDFGTIWRPVHPQFDETKSDREFSAHVKSSVRDGPVLHLPFGVFPEWPGYPAKESYAYFRYLAFEKIHSVMPVIKQTEGSFRKISLFFGKIPSTQSMTDFGIKGVVLDRNEYPDQGRSEINSLMEGAKASFDSLDGRFRYIGF